MAVSVAIFVVVLQFLENSILVPRVMKGAVGLSPLTVFVAILAGTQYMGVLGALLSIPISAAIQVVVSEYLKSPTRDVSGGGNGVSGLALDQEYGGTVQQDGAQQPAKPTPIPIPAQTGS